MNANEHSQINKNEIQSNSINYYSSPLYNTSPASFLDLNNNNKKYNLGESSLTQYINESIYDDIKNQYETKEILNELRSKYLPNSLKKNNYSINMSQNMTYVNNRIPPNINYSTYTDYNRRNSNVPNISTEKIDYNKSQKENSKLFQSSFLDNKELTNINESIKLNNNDSLKISSLNIEKEIINKNKNNENNNNENKTYLNEYLINENEKLKKINKNYELLIMSLIEYINDINYFFGQNTIDFHNINQIIKYKELNDDNKSLNNLKLILKESKIKILDSYKNKKNNSVPKKKISNIKDILNQNQFNTDKRSFTFNLKEKKNNIDNYKPKIIDDDKNKNFEINIFKSSEFGGIRRARTVKDRLPKSFWSQNKKVKFKD